MDAEFIEFLNKKRAYFSKVIFDELASFWNTKNIQGQTGISHSDVGPAHFDKALRAPSYYIFKMKSKKLRPIFGCLTGEALGATRKAELGKFFIFPEILHSASLVMDDIEDGARIRRGKPCLHIQFGVDTAVNTANALYFMPFYALKNCRFPEKDKSAIYNILTESMNRMHIGQALDILWHNKPEIAVSEKQYVVMASLKTSSFFMAEAGLAGIISEVPGALAKKAMVFAANIGIAFQVIDDILDLTLDHNEIGAFGKRFAQDITEGKKTLIAIYALQRASRKDRVTLERILKSHTRRTDLLKKAVGIFNKYGCIKSANEYAIGLAQNSWHGFSRFLMPSQGKKFLGLFCDFITERRF